MINNTKAYPGTQAVLRAVTLLKAFDDERRQWGLTELARETGLNKSTVFRLLSALESEGMVMRTLDGDSYTLGPELVALGGRALRANSLYGLAHAELEALASETGETASLEIMSEGEILIIDEVLGDHLVSGVRSIGTRWPIHATSTGLAMMAHWPEAEVDKLLAEPLPAITPKTVTAPAKLRRSLTETRSRGYAVADEALEIGLIAIGAPLRDYQGEVLAAISVFGPKLRLTPERVREIGCRLAETAARLSARLGYRPTER